MTTMKFARIFAAITLAPAGFCGPSHVLRGESSPQTPPAIPARSTDSSALIAQSRERLRVLRTEIVRLGQEALGRVNAGNTVAVKNAAINERIKAQSGESTYENAMLSREIAEIAVVEYEEGIYKQDEATMKGEVLLAESDFAREPDVIELVQDRLAKVKKLSTGSAPDLATEYTLEDRIVEAQLRAPRKRLELETLRAKLDCFRQFAKAKRVTELKAEVARFRSEELAKKALWEQSKSRLKKLEEAARHPEPLVRQQDLLTLLDEGVSLVEKLKTTLDHAEKGADDGEMLRKEVESSLARLQTLVEQAHAENGTAAWVSVKPRVRAAAVRYLVPDKR